MRIECRMSNVECRMPNVECRMSNRMSNWIELNWRINWNWNWRINCFLYFTINLYCMSGTCKFDDSYCSYNNHKKTFVDEYKNSVIVLLLLLYDTSMLFYESKILLYWKLINAILYYSTLQVGQIRRMSAQSNNQRTMMRDKCVGRLMATNTIVRHPEIITSY